MQRDLASLLDILQSARLIQSNLQGVSKEFFETNVTLQDATLYRLAVIGEATARISDEFKQQHPDIPWQRIKAMRNILVHVYDDINFEIVWRVSTRSLPELIAQIEPLLDEPA